MIKLDSLCACQFIGLYFKLCTVISPQNQALNWDLCPETVISWMKLYLQMASLYDQTNLLIPQFSRETYLRVTQVVIWNTDIFVLNAYWL